LERLRQNMIGERIRLLIASGDQERALEIGRQEALLGSGVSMHPRPDSTTRDDMRAMSWVRLAIARGELTGAAELGQIWKRFTAKAGAARCAMRWEILLARAYATQGQIPRAQRELRSALARAVTGNFVRSFLDEGDQIGHLLTEQLSASQIQTGTIDGFVALLLQESSAHCRSKVGDTATQPDLKTADGNRLTKIQSEILHMASAGLQNRAIAQRIGMTEGSVKWYMQQIFNKIGIRKRAGSLERARSLGLL
jgi:LuxR family maltose regulon positive regulatory protein